MAKYKTEFELTDASENKIVGQISIIGQSPKDDPYVQIAAIEKPAFIQDKDLERFAVNILKAIKSKKLK